MLTQLKDKVDYFGSNCASDFGSNCASFGSGGPIDYFSFCATYKDQVLTAISQKK